jgi:phosphonate transport system substrate-binding protein
MARGWQGFTPLVRDRALLEGLVLVQQGSPIRQLRDLQGASLAFPAPNAFAASLLIRALLARDGIRITPLYVGTHTNGYRSVALGSSQAGGGVNQTLSQERPEVHHQLRILWRTPGFPAHPFSAAGRVPRDRVGGLLRLTSLIAIRPVSDDRRRCGRA